MGPGARTGIDWGPEPSQASKVVATPPDATPPDAPPAWVPAWLRPPADSPPRGAPPLPAPSAPPTAAPARASSWSAPLEVSLPPQAETDSAIRSDVPKRANQGEDQRPDVMPGRSCKRRTRLRRDRSAVRRCLNRQCLQGAGQPAKRTDSGCGGASLRRASTKLEDAASTPAIAITDR